VEESFQAGKGQVGLDQHQVRRWTSWHRFSTLALAAVAVLAICVADTRTADRHPRPDMIQLTVNEIRRLINVLLIQPTRSITYRLRWSNWRRRHQARARRAHYTRRLNHELQP
jgi:anti-sigma-K factor RskA